MANQNLTDKIIRALKPGQTKGDLIENLYIKANRAKGSYSWIYKFTNPDNKQERPKITIGSYPMMSRTEALEIAVKYNALLKRGINPKTFEEKEAAEAEIQAMTFKQIAEMFKDYHRHNVKDINDSMRRVELYLYKKFGDMPLNKINLAEWHLHLKQWETLKNDTVKKVAGTARQILDYAQMCGYIAHNPLTTLRKSLATIEAKTNPTIKPEELPAFMRALWLSDAERQTKQLIEWQLLTATRAGEAVRARWDEIDFKRKVWTIPAEKMKAGKIHVIPLSSQALALLDEMRAMNGDYEYIFHSFRSKSGHMSSQSANKCIGDGVGYKGVLTSHGLRSIFSTYMNDLHDPMIHHEHIESCLAHVTGNGVSRRYNHSEYLEPKRYIMQRWGDYIAQCKHP
ncbi:hypothetical protein BKK51_12490 [Rodentibacter trehalosifermentans]|uniref:Tyr recombinase domain-containing protein n=1 Tax=Rodentibacter trehalosifermentans TaxID=1908263 RepID=A0A1V3ILH2_9PAST|nr:tyrosine-type recombinase/integrase [Rodentibacter trehalosifermentans]OOF42804.1 hypothetical protein BKK51_12490 [Rodentibacter trehalosifermentans]